MTIFVGTTIADAKQQAKKQLKLTANQELQLEVIQEPRRGFFGIGRRLAKVAATVTTKETLEKPQMTNRESAAKPAPVKDSPVSENRQAPQETANGETDELDPAEIKRRHQANIDRVQHGGQLLVAYLTDVCAQLGIKVAPQIMDVQAHELKIDLQTAASGKVIGRHGRRINALEQLSNTFMDYHGAPKTTVILDTSDYRKRREEAVKSLAERSVTEVVASGKAVFLDPMPARERKLIHQTLEGNSHVKTYSHGREPYRSIVIAPKN